MDDEVINRFLKPEPKDKKKVETYPWTIDEDAQATLDSIATAEEITKNKLSTEAVRNGGMDMIFHYDNTARVFERNTP